MGLLAIRNMHFVVWRMSPLNNSAQHVCQLSKKVVHSQVRIKKKISWLYQCSILNSSIQSRKDGLITSILRASMGIPLFVFLCIRLKSKIVLGPSRYNALLVSSLAKWPTLLCLESLHLRVDAREHFLPVKKKIIDLLWNCCCKLQYITRYSTL
jgi:hypothetical protein